MAGALEFPALGLPTNAATRDALHGYAGVLGAWLKQCRPKRKHWWHASLRPSVHGLTTGIVYGKAYAELELDLAYSRCYVRGSRAAESLPLTGQSAKDFAAGLRELLPRVGVHQSTLPPAAGLSDKGYADYSAKEAARMHGALAAVAATLEKLRAGIREETSPIQLWPHHFDLSMLWLPGGKIDGEDPADEESADKQMNFGFVFGDETIAEPYFYVTAYPLPEQLPQTKLPPGTTWRSEGFDGAVTLYKYVAAQDDPESCLLDAWTTLLDAGRQSI